MAQQPHPQQSANSGQNQQPHPQPGPYQQPHPQPGPYQQPWPYQQPHPQLGPYQQPYQQPGPYQRARSNTGCLTAWAIFGIIASGFLLLLSLTGIRYADPVNTIPVLNISIMIGVLVGYTGVLRLKKWGYYLVLSMYILLAIVRLALIASYPVANQGGGALIVGIIGGIIFFTLAQSALPYMD
jgi:hypothetical protein